MKITVLIALIFGFFAGQVGAEPIPSTDAQYKLINTNGHQIHVLEFNPQKYQIIAVKADEKSKRETVLAMAKKHQAYAAVNGGFFEIDEPYEGYPAGALKIAGVWIGKPIANRAALGWNENSQPVLMDRLRAKLKEGKIVGATPLIDRSPRSTKAWQQVQYVVGGIPLLIKNGKPLTDFHRELSHQSFINDRHARTAVCIKKDNQWLWMVASHTKPADRKFVQPIIEGFTIAELVQFLSEQGCVNAINLDGGGSSTMVIKNKTINKNAGDRDELVHRYEERPVSDALLIIPASNPNVLN
jgi:exopolysaccharide biosynthesis protein